MMPGGSCRRERVDTTQSRSQLWDCFVRRERRIENVEPAAGKATVGDSPWEVTLLAQSPTDDLYTFAHASCD